MSNKTRTKKPQAIRLGKIIYEDGAVHSYYDPVFKDYVYCRHLTSEDEIKDILYGIIEYSEKDFIQVILAGDTIAIIWLDYGKLTCSDFPRKALNLEMLQKIINISESDKE